TGAGHARCGGASPPRGPGGRRHAPAGTGAPGLSLRRRDARSAAGLEWRASQRAHRSTPMPFVVTENCIKCKYTDCVEVCPVDCFHEGPNFLVIDPDECIDCTLCEPECPVNAIYPEDDVPAGQEGFIALNAELSRDWPVITVRKEPLAEA